MPHDTSQYGELFWSDYASVAVSRCSSILFQIFIFVNILKTRVQYSPCPLSPDWESTWQPVCVCVCVCVCTDRVPRYRK